MKWGFPVVSTGIQVTAHAPVQWVRPSPSWLNEYTVTATPPGAAFGYSSAATAVVPPGSVSCLRWRRPGAGIPDIESTRVQSPCHGGRGNTVSRNRSPNGTNGLDGGSNR